MKAQVDCLLSKIHQVGPGNQQMAKRREWALIEDERMSRERAAQWLRQIEGVHTIRKGFIKTALKHRHSLNLHNTHTGEKPYAFTEC